MSTSSGPSRGLPESSLDPNSSTDTSASLLARVRAKDDAAWERLVMLFAPLVYHWCKRSGLQSHDTEDVFQEVFESVHARIDSFRKERRGDSFRAWLFTVTRNKIRDHFRRRQKEPQGEGGTEALRRMAQVRDQSPPAAEELEAEELAAEELAKSNEESSESEVSGVNDLLEDPAADESEERALTRRALELIRGEFREKTWKAFWRTAVDDLPAPEVADELEMSPGAVRVAKSRVLRRLREELGEVE